VLNLRDRYFIAEEPAPAPHLARPKGCAALCIVLVTVPCASRSCEQFPDRFNLHLDFPDEPGAERSGEGFRLQGSGLNSSKYGRRVYELGFRGLGLRVEG